MQLGLRTRYRSTSVHRPLNGLILDSALRLGRAAGEALAKPRFDLSADLQLAVATPVTDRARIYLRGRGLYQLKAAPPNHNWIGGETTLRGLPEQWDQGRRILLGRVQTHVTLLRNWLLPLTIANRIWKIFPVWGIDLETVSFYDIGLVGDPEFGWRTPQQGFGGGLRLVIPPDLVFKFDVATSATGELMFYFGLGETI